MDKPFSFDKYKPENFYNSDKQVRIEEIQGNDWDRHFFADGVNLSAAEVNKTIEMMSVLRDEVIDALEESVSPSFAIKRINHQIQGTEITSARSLNDPGYILQVFKGGSEDGKVKVFYRDKDESEIDLVIQRDGNFMLTKERLTAKGFQSESYSTNPKDRAKYFDPMTKDATKLAVELVNRYLNHRLQPHKPGVPSAN